MRIGKIASYRMDEKFRNCKFLELNFDFRDLKKSRNLLIYRLENFKNFQFRKFQYFPN